MESAPTTVAALVASHGQLSFLPSGKVLCACTKHEMPPDLAAARKHISSRKYRKAFDYAADYSHLLPHIIPHLKDERKLFCTLTRKALNKVPRQLADHAAGKRFKRLKAEVEEREAKRAAKAARKEASRAAYAKGGGSGAPPGGESSGSGSDEEGEGGGVPGAEGGGGAVDEEEAWMRDMAGVVGDEAEPAAAADAGPSLAERERSIADAIAGAIAGAAAASGEAPQPAAVSVPAQQPRVPNKMQKRKARKRKGGAKPARGGGGGGKRRSKVTVEHD